MLQTVGDNLIDDFSHCWENAVKGLNAFRVRKNKRYYALWFRFEPANFGAF
jgi:hypothetical protein